MFTSFLALSTISILIVGMGYIKESHIESVRFRQQNNWGSYLYLILTGMRFTFSGLIMSLLIFAFILLFLSVINIIAYFAILLCNKAALDFSWHSLVTYVWDCVFDVDWIDSEKNLTTDAIIHILIIFFSIIFISFSFARSVAKQLNNNLEEKLQEFKNIDNWYEFIISAMQMQELVKVVLKSKKVYIGYIDGGQFNRHQDSNSLFILPVNSAYINQDFKLIFLTDYSELYLKHSNETEDLLNKFKTIIRRDDIESISVFVLEYYNELNNDTSIII